MLFLVTRTVWLPGIHSEVEQLNSFLQVIDTAVQLWNQISSIKMLALHQQKHDVQLQIQH